MNLWLENRHVLSHALNLVTFMVFHIYDRSNIFSRFRVVTQCIMHRLMAKFWFSCFRFIRIVNMLHLKVLLYGLLDLR